MTVSISSQPVYKRVSQGGAQSYLDNKPKVAEAVLPHTQPDTTATDKTESTKVNLSLAALAKQGGSSALADAQRQMAEDKKAKARERLAEIKERVDQLKRLVALFGSMAPKALLRELQQLTGELKSVAKDLKEGWEASSPSSSVTLTINDANVMSSATSEENPGETMAISPEDAARLTEQIAEDVSSDKLLAATAADNKHPNQSDSTMSSDKGLPETVLAALQQQTEEAQAKKQRREDQQQLQEVIGDMQLLFNILKAQLRQQDRDKDTDKQLDNISEQLADSGKLAAELTNASNEAAWHINITV
ncbi:hypothetical protein [Alishewanella longhuensis]|nr:hypothetical protein [Alishewanella longhuensis]